MLRSDGKSNNMKKIIICLSVLICLLFSGCERKETSFPIENSKTNDSDFSFDDGFTIIDSYSEKDMVIETSYDSVSCTALAFDGRRNLCVLTSGKKDNSTLTIALSLTS